MYRKRFFNISIPGASVAGAWSYSSRFLGRLMRPLTRCGGRVRQIALGSRMNAVQAVSRRVSVTAVGRRATVGAVGRIVTVAPVGRVATVECEA